jgi:NodT family efflux transporter outer membrane factor (OMF) lipoprotein
MTKQHHKIVASLCIPVLFTIACITPKNQQQQKINKLPLSYNGKVDSLSNIAMLQRDVFFKDEQLKSLLQDVLKHNPDVHIVVQRLQSSQAFYKMSKAAFLPSVLLNAQSSATKYGKYTMEGVGNFDTNLSDNIEEGQKIGTNPTPFYWLGAGLNWEIDLWGKLKKMKQAARFRYLASEQGVKLLKSMLTAQTMMLYYELIALDMEAAIVKKNIELQEQALEIVEAQKAGGRATELAVQQFKGQLYNTKSIQFSIKQKVAAIENSLNALAGRYNGQILRAQRLNASELYQQNINAGVPQQILDNRPDIQEAFYELNATRADVGAARAAFLPSLNLSGYSAYNAFNSNFLFAASSLGYQLLGGITAPVFQKRQLKTQFGIANARQEQAFYHYQKTVLNAYRDVVTNISALENTEQSYQLKLKEANELAQAVQTSTDLYVTGYAGYLEIITAQKSKLEADLELIILEKNKMVQMVELYQSLGGGWQ